MTATTAIVLVAASFAAGAGVTLTAVRHHLRRALAVDVITAARTVTVVQAMRAHGWTENQIGAAMDARTLASSYETTDTDPSARQLPPFRFPDPKTPR